MASAKSFIKGLAAGAALAGAAVVAMSMKGDGKKNKELSKAAHDVKDKVVKHAMSMGKMTKDSFGKIVDATVTEYKGVKTMSQDDLAQLGTELKKSWAQVEGILKKKGVAPAAKGGSKKGKK